jgi:SHS2 domain-containing protein
VRNYELLEHTADIGIRVSAQDLSGLFRAAALAMFDIIAERKAQIKESAKKEITIRLKTEDLEELLISWLNELLSLSSVKGLIFSEFRFAKLEKCSLEAVAAGEDISNYQVNAEIKAATYHQLRIEETKSGWQAEIIFDV